MNTWLTITVASLSQIAIGSPAMASTSQSLRSILEPEQVCSLTSDWQIGTGVEGVEIPMFETVRPIIEGNTKTWRAIHHSADPLSDARSGSIGFDVTHVDAQTLRPLEGRNQRGAMSFHFVYTETTANKLAPNGDIEDSVALSEDYPLPWYPGSAILTMAIPWRTGLVASGMMVDNYAGEGKSRLRPVTLAVTGERMADFNGGARRVFDAVWTSPNGFEFRQTVTASRPHHAIASRMFPRPGGRSFDSRVMQTNLGDDCALLSYTPAN
jgi:hypothetical protein